MRISLDGERPVDSPQKRELICQKKKQKNGVDGGRRITEELLAVVVESHGSIEEVERALVVEGTAASDLNAERDRQCCDCARHYAEQLRRSDRRWSRLVRQSEARPRQRPVRGNVGSELPEPVQPKHDDRIRRSGRNAR